MQVMQHVTATNGATTAGWGNSKGVNTKGGRMKGKSEERSA
jgi:hypothetical protein